MPKPFSSSSDLLKTVRELNQATERNDIAAVNEITTHIISQLPATEFIQMLFEKVKTSAFFQGNNSLFYLAMALYESSLHQDKRCVEKITRLFRLLIEQCETALLTHTLLRIFFERTPTISESRADILCFLAKAADHYPAIQEEIIFKLLKCLGGIQQSQCDANMMTIISLAQTCLQQHLKAYILATKNFDAMKPQMLLGVLIDYQPDALCAYDKYSMRGFVLRSM